MASFTSRFRSGEHEQVWADIRALGPEPDRFADDIDEVAAETMRRVARHVDRIAAALPGLGFVGNDERLRVPPTAAEVADLDALAVEIGPLPAALRACLREVGQVSFLGDWPDIGLFYRRPGHPGGMPPGPGFPDPLDLAPAWSLRTEWDEWLVDDWATERFVFDLAPDALHKSNISGDEPQHIALPDGAADPVLHGVLGRPGITLVEYLRESISWGGFPGWSSCPPAPAVLDRLRARPDF